jgi:hypothetical protein
MSKSPLMVTKAGWLTRYALACGYIEKKSSKGIETKLYALHGVYFVSKYDFNEHTKDYDKSFTNLTDARKAYQKL